MLRQYYEIAIKRKLQKGQVTLVTVVFFLLISLVIITSFSYIGVGQLRDASELVRGKKALATAQSGIEDIVLRTSSAGDGTYPAVNTDISILLNGGVSTAKLVYDGWNDDYPKQFTISAVGNVSNRYRKIALNFEIPDENLNVGLAGAIYAGHLGVELQDSSNIFGTAGYNKGNVFSNGSILSAGDDSVLINGSASAARHISNIIQQQHNKDLTQNDIASCPNCTFKITGITTENNRVLAQSFIANTTANLYQVDIFMKKVGAPTCSITIDIIKNKRYNKNTLATCTNTDEAENNCIDLPSNVAGDQIESGSVNDVGASFEWKSLIFGGQNPNPAKSLIMNEKYWIVTVTCATANTANHYEFAGLDGNYTYGNDGNGKSNTDYACDVGMCPPGDLASLYIYGNSPSGYRDFDPLPAPLDKDIAFRIYMGTTRTEISDSASPTTVGQTEQGSASTQSKQLEIIGNVIAEYMRSIDIGGTAYFESVPTTVNEFSGAGSEVKAGADYIWDLNTPWAPAFHTDSHPTNPISQDNLPQPDNIDMHADLPDIFNYTGDIIGDYCPSNIKGPLGLLSRTSVPTGDPDNSCTELYYTVDAKRHCRQSYCSCSANGQRNGEFCKDIDDQAVRQRASQAGVTLPTVPESEEPFGKERDIGKVMTFKKLTELRKMASSFGTTTLGASITYFPNSNNDGQVCIDTTSGELIIGSPDNTLREMSMPGMINKDMLNFCTGETVQNIQFPYGVIDGDLRLIEFARLNVTGLKAGKCPYDESTAPCFVIRITGNLDMAGHSEIRIEIPLGESEATYEATVYILVDGAVTLTGGAKIYVSNASIESNAAVIVSYGSGVTLGTPAVNLSSTDPDNQGPVLLAFRGAIAVQQSFRVRAIAAQKIYIRGNDVRVSFDEGLKLMNSERGGTQKAGANITAYYETQ